MKKKYFIIFGVIVILIGGVIGADLLTSVSIIDKVGDSYYIYKLRTVVGVTEARTNVIKLTSEIERLKQEQEDFLLNEQIYFNNCLKDAKRLDKDYYDCGHEMLIKRDYYEQEIRNSENALNYYRSLK